MTTSQDEALILLTYENAIERWGKEFSSDQRIGHPVEAPGNGTVDYVVPAPKRKGRLVTVNSLKEVGDSLTVDGLSRA